MTKHERSILFTLATCALNIVLTLGIMLFLICMLLLIVLKTTGKIDSSSYVVQAGIPVILVFGLIFSLKLFTNITGAIIEILHLEDKLDAKIVSRYSKENRL